MAKVRFSIDEKDQIEKLLMQFPGEIEEEISQGITFMMNQIAEDARGMVRVDTGSLQRSIKVGSNGQGSAYVSAGGGLNNKTGREVIYAPYVEFGTGAGYNINSSTTNVFYNLQNYASLFQRGGQVNLPSRPFLFNNAANRLREFVAKYDESFKR